MSSSERIEINVNQTRLIGGSEFQNGGSAKENGMAILTAVSMEQNRINNASTLSGLGLHNFSLETDGTISNSTSKSAFMQQTETNDDASARDRRISEGWSKNPVAARFFEDKAVDLAFAKAGARLEDAIDLGRAIQEILQNKWCMGAHDTTYEDIKKDWDILKKFGVTEKDVNAIIDQAEEKHIPGGRSCLIG